MKIGIMQPYFLPYIGYWQLLNAVDKYVIYDDVNYIKGGWINRNKILINKSPNWINLRLNSASPNKLINEIELENNIFNTKKNLKKITESYKKAPYFDDVIKVVEKIINYENLNLAKYLENSIRCVCEYLDIKTELIISSDIEKQNDLKAEEKVIEICKILGATEYYNAIGGKELYSFDNFKNEGIELKFLKTGKIEYKQFEDEFTPYLSILDVMMFNSKEEVKLFLNNFILERE